MSDKAEPMSTPFGVICLIPGAWIEEIDLWVTPREAELRGWHDGQFVGGMWRIRVVEERRQCP